MTNLAIGSVERLVWKHSEKLIAVEMAKIKPLMEKALAFW